MYRNVFEFTPRRLIRGVSIGEISIVFIIIIAAVTVVVSGRRRRTVGLRQGGPLIKQEMGAVITVRRV